MGIFTAIQYCLLIHCCCYTEVSASFWLESLSWIWRQRGKKTLKRVNSDSTVKCVSFLREYAHPGGCGAWAATPEGSDCWEAVLMSSPALLEPGTSGKGWLNPGVMEAGKAAGVARLVATPAPAVSGVFQQWGWALCPPTAYQELLI